MLIDADIAPLLERVNAKPPPGTPPPTLAEHRAGIHRLAAIVGPNPPIEVYSVVDSTIPGPAGDVPVRTYRATRQPTATVVYFHGGGWITGDLDSHDFFVRKLAHETGYVFVAVDYRLAPENPFPAGLEDCMAAATWVDDHAEDYGGIVGRLAVAGDSAGGNLAAVVARKFLDDNRHLTAQLLLYPVIDSAGDYPSRHEYSDGYLTTANDIAVSAQVYLGDNPKLITTQDVAPIRATDLAGLAPAVVGVAHADPLRDEGLAYAEALAAAGVHVFVCDYQGMIHTFAAMFAISATADRALTELLVQFSKKLTGRATSTYRARSQHCPGKDQTNQEGAQHGSRRPEETEHRKAEMFELRPTPRGRGIVSPAAQAPGAAGTGRPVRPDSTTIGRGMKTPVTQTGPRSWRGLR